MRMIIIVRALVHLILPLPPSACTLPQSIVGVVVVHSSSDRFTTWCFHKLISHTSSFFYIGIVILISRHILSWNIHFSHFPPLPTKFISLNQDETANRSADCYRFHCFQLFGDVGPRGEWTSGTGWIAPAHEESTRSLRSQSRQTWRTRSIGSWGTENDSRHRVGYSGLIILLQHR